MQVSMQGQTVWVEMKGQNVSTQMSEAFQKTPLSVPTRAVHYQTIFVLSKDLDVSGLEDRNLGAGEQRDEEGAHLMWHPET